MRNIVYWATTGLLGLAMVGAGYANLSHSPQIVQSMQHLGYPLVVATILGFWKLAGALAIFAPGMARLKEWAYAGFFFCFTGAIASHVATGDGPGGSAPAAVLLALVLISWATRPTSRGGLMGPDAR